MRAALTLASAVAFSVVGAAAAADPAKTTGVIDFEGLPTGFVTALSSGAGFSGDFPGSIGVIGANPNLGGGNNAMIVPASSPKRIPVE